MRGRVFIDGLEPPPPGGIAPRFVNSIAYRERFTTPAGESMTAFGPPNHCSPVRRELAIACGGFPETSWGEDAEFARRLWPLLKTEATVERDLYFYWARRKTHHRGTETQRKA